MVTGWTCDACGDLVTDRWRRRHIECPPPPLPQAFHEARERVRNMHVNRK